MEDLKSLVMKLAIRKEPVILGKDVFGNKIYDYSYTTTPIRIIKVTDNHILYDHKGTKEEKIFKTNGILDKRWIDNNWMEYDKLNNIDLCLHCNSNSNLCYCEDCYQEIITKNAELQLENQNLKEKLQNISNFINNRGRK